MALSTLSALITIGGALIYPAVTGFVLPNLTVTPSIEDRSASHHIPLEIGNPFVDGWYADPDTAIYDGRYWVFPTTSRPYEEQTYFDAFSSPDLIHWTKHPTILNITDIRWAYKALWAPASVSRNGKYYLYFSANDLQEDEEAAGLEGGIGVAVADRPEGPYRDAIGQPLIGNYYNGAQPIDQDVFIDNTTQAYIYYGGHGHANVAKLNDDMVSIGWFDDQKQYIEITPKGYVEGPQMFKRNGKYYFTWSEGGWTGPDYAVSYAMGFHPTGPFSLADKILQQDDAVARGSGHNGIFNVPDTDIWYMVYHRRPLSENDPNHRVLAYDRMYFFADTESIKPVKMLVRDNFRDGNMLGWKTFGGNWTVEGYQITDLDHSGESRAMLDTNFGDLVFDATITLGDVSGDAGLIFRSLGLDRGETGFTGYYASFSGAGAITLEKAESGRWSVIARTTTEVELEKEYEVRVTAIGHEIQIYMGASTEPRIIAEDHTYGTGSTGVGIRGTKALFGDISVSRPSESV
ncbi:glycoside hydrolase family 43 protein [Hypomontagnella monticulosa]|nr:glycoside hydrolase family 43 protein [Hypomontagnella monticulosa]